MISRTWFMLSLAAAFVLSSVFASSPAEQPSEVLPMPKVMPTGRSCCAESCTKTCPVGKPLANSKEEEIERNLLTRVTIEFKNAAGQVWNKARINKHQYRARRGT